MLVKCLRPGKVAGLRLKTGEVADVPDWVAQELEGCEPPVIEILAGPRATNVETERRATAWTFTKLQEGE